MLIDYDDDLSIVPRLAESWDQSTDNTQIKLNLRKGVQFHTGREFTSDDVKYNLLRARDPKNPYAAVVAPGSAWWTSWEKPDKYTIILKSDKPRPGVFDFLQYLRILDKDTMEGPDATTKVVGTGAFKFVEWVPGDHITLAKNPNYWETGQPYLDGVEVTIFRDAQAMVAALEAGALDVADLVPIPDADRLQQRLAASRCTRPTTSASSSTRRSTPACRRPTTSCCARRSTTRIDRKRFVDTVMKGFTGEPRALPWAKSSPAFDPEKNKAYAYDLDKAQVSCWRSQALTNVDLRHRLVAGRLRGRVPAAGDDHPGRPGQDRHHDQPQADRIRRRSPSRARASIRRSTACG